MCRRAWVRVFLLLSYRAEFTFCADDGQFNGYIPAGRRVYVHETTLCDWYPIFQLVWTL